MYRCILIVLSLLLSQILSGQEMLGLTGSNYAGSNGIYLNPSSIANNKLLFDVNIATANAFVQNNYLYLPGDEASFFDLVKGTYAFPFHRKPYGDGERNVYAYYQDKSLKNINVNLRIVGPSFMARYKDHSFTFHTGLRTVSSTRRLPYDVANFTYYGMDFYPQHNINYKHENFDMAAMTWWEVGFTYATTIKRSYSNLWSVGMTVNKLFGYGGVYLNWDQVDYIAYNDSILNINDMTADMGMALPMNYQTDEFDLTQDLVRGGGWSTDVGITYQFKRNGYRKKLANRYYTKRFEDYDYKFGFSILDLGYVTLKQNAQKHQFTDVSNNWINVEELVYENIQDEIRDVSTLLYGDPDASYAGDRITIFLPTALSLQFDYHYMDAWYISSVVVMPLKFARTQLERPAIIAVTPRFEKRAVEISMPLSLYDWRYPRIGLAIRIWDLTLGTDRLGGYFGSSDFTGMDIYASLKLNFVRKDRRKYNRKDPCAF